MPFYTFVDHLKHFLLILLSHLIYLYHNLNNQVDCENNGVVVPRGFVKEGKIVLNISSSATESRLITNNSVSFKARFSGKPQKIIIPCEAVLTIYAQETGEGMFFDDKFETNKDTNKKPSLTVLD